MIVLSHVIVYTSSIQKLAIFPLAKVVTDVFVEAPPDIQKFNTFKTNRSPAIRSSNRPTKLSFSALTLLQNWCHRSKIYSRNKDGSPLRNTIEYANAPYCYWHYKRLTSLERFISLSTLITIVFSLSPTLNRFAAPRVLRTDRIFLKPKS